MVLDLDVCMWGLNLYEVKNLVFTIWIMKVEVEPKKKNRKQIRRRRRSRHSSALSAINLSSPKKKKTSRKGKKLLVSHLFPLRLHYSSDH